MTVPLFPHLPHIQERIESAKHMLLGLDYDGTLTPIVDDPRKAVLSPETREVLGILANSPNYTLAIVSGRALEDVRSMVAMDGLIYAGNHGLEIRGPGLHFVEGAAMAELERMAELAQTLAARSKPIAGARVENKRLTISVHFRCVAVRELQSLLGIVEDTVAEGNGQVRLTSGHKVLEIRPCVDWHKGQAMRWIQGQLGQRDALNLFLGDDETDEDAFHALPEAITIKVGDPSDSCALYYLEGPAEVKAFLVWLAQLRGKETLR